MARRRSRLPGLALAVAAVASVAVLPATAGAATQRCPKFWVVKDDPQSDFVAGRYWRLNFAPRSRIAAYSCDYTYHVFRSYLYEPRSLTGWAVQPLRGELSGQLGKRFVKRGTNGRVGFDVFRPADA